MAALATLATDAVVGGDYRVVAPLAAGGMGAVYVAEQLSTGKRRALKVMHPGMVADPVLRGRFGHEARVGSTIASDHVVEVIGAGVDDATGLPWLAMELLDGEDLAVHVARHGALSAEETVRLLRQLCHALAAAHEAGVIHRDIKPQNVFLAQARTIGAPTVVKVLDFGIAKLVASSPTANTALVGSPAWMAPEQTDPRARATAATDIWAVGLLAFFMRTGRTFWLAANDADASLQVILRECLVEPIARASTRAAELGVGDALSSAFDRWFARCVDRDPSARFASVAELLVELDSALASQQAPLESASRELSPAELGALSTQRFIAERALPAALDPLPETLPSEPAPNAMAVVPPEGATTTSALGLSTHLSAAPQPARTPMPWPALAGALLLVAAASGGAVAYWARARDGSGSHGGQEEPATASRSAVASSSPPSASAAPPARPPSAEPGAATLPLSFDATAYEHDARRAAATVITDPELTAIMAAGVTDEGLVDLSAPDHAVNYSYRTARDDRCAYVRIALGKQQVWSLPPEACPGARVGPPRCNVAHVMRRALTGITVKGEARVTVNYSGDSAGKPSWAVTSGGSFEVGGMPDDCARATR